MKKLIKISLSCLMLLCSVYTHAQTGIKKGFTISGTIKGLRNGTVVLTRSGQPGKAAVKIDSTGVKDGKFILKGNLPVPELLSLQFKPGNWNTRLFIENGVLNLTADTAGAKKYDAAQGRKGAELSNVKLTGSSSQDQYNTYLHAPELLKFNAQFKDIEYRLKTAKDPDEKKKIRGENSAAGNGLNKWRLQFIRNFIEQHPESVVGAYLFGDYHSFDFETSLPELEAIVNQFKGPARQSAAYLELAKEVEEKKALQPGHVAPDFTLLKRDSTSLTLSATRGQYVLIDFWASWCVPCRKAIPHWKEVYEKYHGKGFEILSVSGDNVWKNWTKAMDVEKMPWPQVIDDFPSMFAPSVVGTKYRTSFIPFYVLLDKEGKILVYSGDEKAVEEKLKEVFQF